MEDNKKFTLNENEKILENIIDIYKDIFSQNENQGSLNDKAINKDSALLTLKDNYNSVLDSLRESGVDITKYPKSLEDLSK